MADAQLLSVLLASLGLLEVAQQVGAATVLTVAVDAQKLEKTHSAKRSS